MEFRCQLTRLFPQSCTPIALPANGYIVLSPTSTITLTAGALFTPHCASAALDSSYSGTLPDITDGREPFHASITPQTYATAAATVIAWMLVVMLLITPRTFFMNGAMPSTGLLGRRGMISGATGGASVIGVGSRPWLQKVAALTVAVSLTIATADTFKVASQQWATGYMDAAALREAVVDSTEIKVSRVVSDIFLWLAQVQTLIRLFPRHKEKVLIKWIGFALILLDSSFSCVNTFMGNPVGRPRRFVDAIPALAYLFQLALSMLYAAWVIYYAITKRRYAFYHSMMWNISVVALLSIVAILTPVVFFITDISDATVAGWGDYFRWVGAAAASVIVWEWVERIEALEREEKKDGILGREVFDGDEMLDITPSDEINWPQNRYERAESRKKKRGKGSGGSSVGSRKASSTGALIPGHGQWQNLSHRFTKLPFWTHRSGSGENEKVPSQDDPPLAPPKESYDPSAPVRTRASRPDQTDVLPPLTSASPVSRSDTTSAASTVYALRFHTITPLDHPAEPVPHVRQPHPAPMAAGPSSDLYDPDLEKAHGLAFQDDTIEPSQRPPVRNGWRAVTDAFRRKRNLPPAEIASGRIIDPVHLSTTTPPPPLAVPSHNYSVWDIKGRLGAFAAEQGEKLRDRRDRKKDDLRLPVTIIPAQPQGSRTWSPHTLQPHFQTTGSDNETQAAALGDTPEHPYRDPTSHPPSDSIQQDPSPTSSNLVDNQDPRQLSSSQHLPSHPLSLSPYPQPTTLQRVVEEGEHETSSQSPQQSTGAAEQEGTGDRAAE